MLKSLARLILGVAGWTMVGEIPPLKKAVFIAAPHTSNWDGFWMLVYKFALDVKVRFLAKHTLFWWPLGAILRGAGAMPIDRSQRAATVEQLARAFRDEEHLFLALAPEGTRKWQPYWKSGFYRIAKAAAVPIVLAYIDYPSKQMGIGITLPEDNTLDEDLELIREFYRRFTGRRPENTGPIAFPAE